MKYISVILPMYNEEANILPMYQKVTKVLQSINRDYEIIFVDDGSRDRTFAYLSELYRHDRHVKAISFRRNYGKAAGLAAGFKQAQGDIVITMDGDLQDEPEEIRKFLAVMDKGYDLVTGWKANKHRESVLRILPSRAFNFMTRKLTGLNIHDFNCPFKAYRREVVKDLNLYGEMHRYIPVLAYWKGYRIAEIKVLNYERKFGKTKYGTGRILKGFFDLITIKYLTSYQVRPLHFFGKLGLIFTSLGFISGFYLFVQWLMGIGIGKRPLLMLSMLMIILGIQFFSMGLVAEMITNMNEKHEKSYSIRKILE